MNSIAIVFGGPSPEHDVSIVSAKNVYQAIADTQLHIFLLGVTQQKKWKLLHNHDLVKHSFQSPIDLDSLGVEIKLIRENGQVFIHSLSSEEKLGPIDVAFPVCHGPFGEDGELQKIFDELKLEYVGSDAKSCEKCFDKVLAKEIISHTAIQQGPYIFCEDSNPSFTEVQKKLQLPWFVKPANMGSSVGISKVASETEFIQALADARIHDHKIVIEQSIDGREIECAILQKGNETLASGTGEVVPTHEFYSYEAKYLDEKGADLIIPADLAPGLNEKIKITAIEAFRALSCRDFARVDFFVTREGQILLNEINTHPGFTNISQFPKLWQQEGVEYKDLILQLLSLAEKRRQP